MDDSATLCKLYKAKELVDACRNMVSAQQYFGVQGVFVLVAKTQI